MVADAEALRAEKRREAADFEARVQAEVEPRLSEMSAFAGHRASPPADELSSPSNDLEPAERTVSSRAGVRENVRKSGARRLPKMSASAGHPRDDGRDHVLMFGAFPPRRPDEEELIKSERAEIEQYAIDAAERLRRAIAGAK